MSNGHTRNIEEYVSGTKEGVYMKSISCEKDKKATDYIQYVEMTQKQLEKILKKSILKSDVDIEKIVLCKDENGYVIRNLFTDKNGKCDCVWKVIHVKEDAVYTMMKQFYSQTVMLWRDMCFEADSLEEIEDHYAYRRGYQALKDIYRCRFLHILPED